MRYFETEYEHGALLGPVPIVTHSQYHCSPLMSQPKDGSRRRIILDLSYPKGNSLNYHVNRQQFDNCNFCLRFLTIDNIVESVRNTGDFPMVFKVDVTRAFCNLRVDPADGLKFGIRWGNSYYLYPAIAFSWVHGSASFQLCSDAIAYIMKQKGFEIHCYIDDYTLTELGLPITESKFTPHHQVSDVPAY